MYLAPDKYYKAPVISRNINQLMCLKTQPPLWMLLDVGYHFVGVLS